jgi:hypothetical protein
VSGTAGDEDGSHSERSADAGTVTLRVFSGADASGSPIRTVPVTRTGASWTTDLAQLADGTYTVQVTQIDAAGNGVTGVLRSGSDEPDWTITTRSTA